MKATDVVIPVIILNIISFIPFSIANGTEWNYSNYLYSLDIISYDNPVIAGQTASITVEVGANIDLVLHVEFKGQFAWGHWVYYSNTINIEPGVSSITEEIQIPIKMLIEPASDFYYYVYVTFPHDYWSSSVWSLSQSVNVAAPSEIGYEGLVGLMSHLKWLVYTSQLPEEIKTSLMSKLEVAGDLIDSALELYDQEMLIHAKTSVNDFLTELDSDDMNSYPASGIWKEQAEKIIELMEYNF